MNGYINFMVTFNLKLKLIFKIRNNIKNKIIKKEYFYIILYNYILYN